MTGPRFGRRRFLGVSVAAACVGCSNSDDSAAPTTTVAGPDDTATGLEFLRAPIRVGPVDEVRAAALTAPTYLPEARAWLVGLTSADADVVASAADERLRPGLEHGLLALSQRCPHLGCRVPFCESSGWFECACHGSMFTLAGEHRGGPGPRGLDGLVIELDGNVVTIRTDALVEGAPVGTVVLDRAAVGPHCVGEAER